MDYIEMAAAPKGMFDKMISNDGLRFATNGSGPTGFRPMAIPVFSHAKPLSAVGMAPAPLPGSSSELSRRGDIPAFGTAGLPVNGSHVALVNGANGSLGMMHLQMPGESGSSHQGDEMMEKGKRSRGEGGRGSRGGGTSSRKRTRAVQADSLTTSEAMPDGSLSGGAAASAGRATPEKTDKSISRRQSGQGAKRGDKKQPQVVATPMNDTLPLKAAEGNVVPSNWSSGIVELYGLQTRALDVSRLMVDISLNDLLSGNFDVPSFSLKDIHDAKVEPQERFEQQIETILHLLPKRSVMGETHSLKGGDLSGNFSGKGPKNPKVMLDLERPVHLEEEDAVSRAGKTEKEMQSDFKPATKLEAVAAEKETRMGSSSVVPDISPSSQVPSRFLLDNQPIDSVENVLSRLKLMPSDPLQTLILQAGADGEMSGSANNRVGNDIVDLCHKAGSVPPFIFSYPHVGPVKAENGRYSQRIWIRGPTAESSGGKGVSGLSGKEGSNGAEEDASNSPSSRHRKVDSQDKVESPKAMEISLPGTHSSSPGQVGPSRPSTIVDTTTLIQEEPRQVENAVGFSSEGNLNPVEIDSGRVDSGSVPASGADATEGAQAAVPECDQQRGGGEAVRPLETPATLAGPQELEASSVRQGKPVASSLAEVKQEKDEQQVTKDPGEESSMDASLIPIAPKEEMPVVLPPLDLIINIRSSSPPQNDSCSSLTACPCSPGAQAAARILCSMSNSAIRIDQEKTDGEKDRKRKVFHPYPGAPAQKTTKSIRVSNSAAVPGDGGREGRKSADGGSVPPSKALVSERRKSLSQVNDASDKPSYSSPRNSGGGGMFAGSRGGTHTGSRSNTLSVKLEKIAAREPTKESASIKELVAKGSPSLPPLSYGGPPSKNGHKGLKTNSYLHSSNSKGSVAMASFSKVPAACTTQRLLTGGTSSRSSRVVHTGNSLASQSPAAIPFKSSRQSIPESRQKTKSELSGRGGGKPSRD